MVNISERAAWATDDRMPDETLDGWTMGGCIPMISIDAPPRAEIIKACAVGSVKGIVPAAMPTAAVMVANNNKAETVMTVAMRTAGSKTSVKKEIESDKDNGCLTAVVESVAVVERDRGSKAGRKR